MIAPDARDAQIGYAPPTLDDVIEDVALAGTPRRSLVLRAPSTARCFVRPLHDTRLRVALGFWGAGNGIAEIVARREGTSPVTLERRKVTGGDSAVWTPIELDLGRFAPEPVALEFRARDATRGGRVTFGDPELVRKAGRAPEPPAARVVLLVVLSGVDRRRLPPWGSGAGLVALSELCAQRRRVQPLPRADDDPGRRARDDAHRSHAARPPPWKRRCCAFPRRFAQSLA